MSLGALVTFGLNGPERARERFEDLLRKEQWTKLHDTAWHRSFPATINESGAMTTARADVEAAAKQAGVTINCWVHLGKDLPTKFELG